MRTVKFKNWIAPLYIAVDGSEHEKYGNASTVNKNKKNSTEPFAENPKTKEGTNCWSDYETEGLFHTWSTSGDEESGMEAVGIIEMADGTVKCVTAENIRFMN